MNSENQGHNAQKELIVEQIREDSAVTFRLEGVLLGPSLPGIESQIKQLADENSIHRIQFDFHGVELIDSQSVGAVLKWHQYLAARDIHLRLLNVHGRVMDVLKICNLDELLDLTAEVESDEQVTDETRELAISKVGRVMQTMAALGQGLIGLDVEGKVLFVNPTAEAMLNVTEKELLGTFFHKIGDFKYHAGKPLKNIENPFYVVNGYDDGSYRLEFLIDLSERGIQHPIEAVATGIQLQNKTIGSMIGLTGLTDRELLEREREERQKLAGALAMARTTCHELNQPLHTISGFAELLLTELEPESSLSGTLRTIVAQIDRMSEITRKLQSITRYQTREYVEGGKMVDLEDADSPPNSQNKPSE